jgi:hydrogenase expression/formation protein HypE
VSARDRVNLKDGAGGRAMRRLIGDVFVSGLAAPIAPGDVGLADLDDGAAVRIGDRWLVATTDAHVVHPRFFPGGDIGRLAVAGTVNDLAMMGCTEPTMLTLAVVLEEGFARADLERIAASIRDTCAEAGVTIMTGDTKVMGKGELDGVVLTTAGVGLTARVVTDKGLRPGDRILVTGTMGDHGFAVLAARGKLELDVELRSDVAPVNGLVRAALAAADGGVTAMKDPTRGGLASALHEMAAKAGVAVLLDESTVPIRPDVRAVGELLGIDPLHVANEGKVVMGVRAEDADVVLAAVRAHPLGRDAAIIGTVLADPPGRVVVDTGFGRRLLAEPEGEPLPRIC